jgi:hypothetical protein
MQPVNEARTSLCLALGVVLVGAQGCGPDCTKLKKDLDAAVDAFAPVSSNSCTSATDCTIVDDSVMRDGRPCWGGCGVAASDARATELSTFLESDPAVTAACKAYLHGSCDKGGGPPMLCPAAVGACTGEQCVTTGAGGQLEQAL